MGERLVRLGAMPVALTRRNKHHVTDADMQLLVLGSDDPATVGDGKHLVGRMPVEFIPSAVPKRYRGHPQQRRIRLGDKILGDDVAVKDRRRCW